MSQRVKVSSKNQTAVPSGIRKKLGIKPGDQPLVEVQDNMILLLPEPKDWVASTRGLGQEVWEGIDPVEYVREERGACPPPC